MRDELRQYNVLSCGVSVDDTVRLFFTTRKLWWECDLELDLDRFWRFVYSCELRIKGIPA